MKTHVVGLFFGIFIVYFAAIQLGENNNTFLDWLSMLIVMGGSLSVSIMTNGLGDTLKVCRLFFKAFSTQKYSKLVITKQIVEVAQKQHFGTLDLRNLDDKQYHPFVLDGLRLIHNKFDSNKFVTLMTNMLIQRRDHHEKMVGKIETLAKYPPAFGMMGTIIGLVAVLKQINSPENMESIGPSMAVALITTLYGILLSNYVLQPIADNLQVRSHKDIAVRQLIVEGMVLISQKQDPVYVRETILSFLTPQERESYHAQNKGSTVREELAA
jgi:chemotaxis protein MotA